MSMSATAEYSGLHVGSKEWMDQWVRDDNTRWLPRDEYNARNADVELFKEVIEEHDPPSAIREFILRFL